VKWTLNQPLPLDEDAIPGPEAKRLRENILQPGLYFLNPREFKVDVLEIGHKQVSLLGTSGGAVMSKGQLASQNAPMQELQQNVLMEQKKKRFDYMKTSGDYCREALRNVVEIDRDTKGIEADTLRIISRAEADAITLVEGKNAKGLPLKATALGTPSAYPLHEFAEQLNPKMKINVIHAEDGTLWTALEKAILGEVGGAAVNPDLAEEEVADKSRPPSGTVDLRKALS
jgi:hypothetical protein